MCSGAFFKNPKKDMSAGPGSGVLDEEVIKEFSGEDDVTKVDMLVLRGLGLSDVSVSVSVPVLV